MTLAELHKGNALSFSKPAKSLRPRALAAGGKRRECANSTFCFIISVLILIAESNIKGTVQWNGSAMY